MQELGKITAANNVTPLEVEADPAQKTNTAHPFAHLLEKKLSTLSLPKTIKAVAQLPMTIRDYFAQALPTRFKRDASTLQKSLPEPAPAASVAKDIDPMITEAIQNNSEKYQVAPELIKSIIAAESNFQAKAVSPVGAQGLMQLMPGTAKELGVKDAFNIQENIEGGVQYFRKMLNMFGQDVKKALAAYNAGPGAVQRHGGVPPYRETQNYVDKILKRYQKDMVV